MSSRKIQNPYIVLSISTTLWVLIAVIDHSINYEVALSIFYLAPISYAVVFSNLYNGIIISILSAAAWHFNDLQTGHQYSSVYIAFWNTLARLGYFLLHSYFLSRYKQLLNISREMAYTDTLTQTGNLRYLTDQLAKDQAWAKRNNAPLTIAYLDLDNFKSVNDQEGHATGDRVLQVVANIARSKIGNKDTIARIGGDEFVVVLVGKNYNDAATILRNVSASLSLEAQANHWPISLSIGAITFTSPQNIPDKVLHKVDKLMYAVKNRGKNDLEHLAIA